MIAAEPTVKIRVRRGHELARVHGAAAERQSRGRPNLDAAVTAAWRRLISDGRVTCLVCGHGELAGLHGCGRCGSQLS